MGIGNGEADGSLGNRCCFGIISNVCQRCGDGWRDRRVCHTDVDHPRVAERRAGAIPGGHRDRGVCGAGRGVGVDQAPERRVDVGDRTLKLEAVGAVARHRNVGGIAHRRRAGGTGHRDLKRRGARGRGRIEHRDREGTGQVQNAGGESKRVGGRGLGRQDVGRHDEPRLKLHQAEIDLRVFAARFVPAHRPGGRLLREQRAVGTHRCLKSLCFRETNADGFRTPVEQSYIP